MAKDQFDQFFAYFNAKTESVDDQVASFLMTSSDFQQTEMPLFQIAAWQKLKNMLHSSEEAINLALKYQVLTESTAFVGVVKQKKQSTHESLQINLNQQVNPHPPESLAG